MISDIISLQNPVVENLSLDQAVPGIREEAETQQEVLQVNHQTQRVVGILAALLLVVLLFQIQVVVRQESH